MCRKKLRLSRDQLGALVGATSAWAAVAPNRRASMARRAVVRGMSLSLLGRGALFPVGTISIAEQATGLPIGLSGGNCVAHRE
ncbi:hypothetical protein D9M68_1008070 [compost metagenome]